MTETKAIDMISPTLLMLVFIMGLLSGLLISGMVYQRQDAKECKPYQEAIELCQEEYDKCRVGYVLPKTNLSLGVVG